MGSNLTLAQDQLLNSGRIDAIDPQTNKKTNVQIFGRANVANEYNVFRYFFTYTCPYGAKYDEQMSSWGKSLPSKFKYVRVPVITQEPNSMIGAKAYYAAWQTDKSKIDLFQKHAYNLIQVQGKDPSDKWTYFEAAKKAGMNTQIFTAQFGTDKSGLLIKNAVILGVKYQITSTPTLTIGGIYTLNPEPIAESKTSFIDFANAMASKYISENGMAIQ